jgi:hypothetical protein
VKLADKKMIETKDLKEKNQSNCLNQNKVKSDDEFTNFIEQKKLEHQLEIE